MRVCVGARSVEGGGTVYHTRRPRISSLDSDRALALEAVKRKE